MRTSSRTLPLLTALLGILVNGCTTTTTQPTGNSSDARTAIRVDVSADGRPALYGNPISTDALIGRLRREGAGRAVALHGDEGVTQAMLVSLQRQLALGGIPNVSIVTPRRATSAVVENTDGLPGEPATAPPAAPTPPRIRRR